MKVTELSNEVGPCEFLQVRGNRGGLKSEKNGQSREPGTGPDSSGAGWRCLLFCCSGRFWSGVDVVLCYVKCIFLVV